VTEQEKQKILDRITELKEKIKEKRQEAIDLLTEMISLTRKLDGKNN
jgi:cell division septum initiation protein DivIVA